MTKKRFNTKWFALVTAASHLVFTLTAHASQGTFVSFDNPDGDQYISSASSSSSMSSEYNAEFEKIKAKRVAEYNDVAEKYKIFLRVFITIYDVEKKSDGSISSISLKSSLQNAEGVSDTLKNLGMPFFESAHGVSKYLSSIFDLSNEELLKNCNLEQNIKILIQTNASLASQIADLTSNNTRLTSFIEQQKSQFQILHQINNDDLEAGHSVQSTETSPLIEANLSPKKPSKWRPVVTHLIAGVTGAGIATTGFLLYLFFGK